jgi:hypothetical protein
VFAEKRAIGRKRNGTVPREGRRNRGLAHLCKLQASRRFAAKIAHGAVYLCPNGSSGLLSQDRAHCNPASRGDQHQSAGRIDVINHRRGGSDANSRIRGLALGQRRDPPRRAFQLRAS